jgi:hypothetical protein
MLLSAIAICVVALVVEISRPPRVLLVGDSITGQYGPTAAATLRSHGYHAVVRAYPGVGLLDRGPRVDAPVMLRRDLLANRACVVIAEFSGNYGIADPPLPGVPLGSEAFFTEWQGQADSFTRQATSAGASVVWLLAPRPVRGDTTVGDRLAAVYHQVQRHGRVNLLDPSVAVTLFDRNGDLYAPDGRHLSATGVKLVGDLVAHEVERNPTWRLRLDALPRSTVARASAALAIVAVAALFALRPWRGRRRRALRAPLPAPH